MQEDGLIVSNRSRKVNLPPLDVEDHKKRRSGRVSKEVFPEQAKAGSRGGRGKMDSPQEAPTTVIVRPIKKGGESYDDLGGKANGTALQSASAASLKSQVSFLWEENGASYRNRCCQQVKDPLGRRVV
uniref:Uncharacterized protein n=1 Tax=Palpitomonas bilix TaxID=652834 RepID=A0A7S3D7T4_9EUKA|mmetsp:Transcript_25611/g.64337  ORF Transcript_25611/g.64337 Transcript_25611/m.64337 type:complete len:128 (+) Transcript_25611:73-456(+)